jgi:hypothetical protein
MAQAENMALKAFIRDVHNSSGGHHNRVSRGPDACALPKSPWHAATDFVLQMHVQASAAGSGSCAEASDANAGEAHIPATADSSPLAESPFRSITGSNSPLMSMRWVVSVSTQAFYRYLASAIVPMQQA